MDCIFCKIIKGDIPSRVVFEDDIVEVIMDVNPHAMGHVLIIPKKHYTDYTEANDIIAHMYKVAEKVGANIMDKLDQKGYCMAINYGDAQEVKHLHLHLMPSNKEKDYDIDDVHKKIKM